MSLECIKLELFAEFETNNIDSKYKTHVVRVRHRKRWICQRLHWEYHDNCILSQTATMSSFIFDPLTNVKHTTLIILNTYGD